MYHTILTISEGTIALEVCWEILPSQNASHFLFHKTKCKFAIWWGRISNMISTIKACGICNIYGDMIWLTGTVLKIYSYLKMVGELFYELFLCILFQFFKYSYLSYICRHSILCFVIGRIKLITNNNYVKKFSKYLV